tara:strand:+ start:193 stop:495 length:303 start_codon:yes stop_codon:yes gene_type:complete
MINYNWDITSVEVDKADGVVYVNWICFGNTEFHKEAETGVAAFSPKPNKEDYVALEDLTPEIVMLWVDHYLGDEGKSSVEAKVAEIIKEVESEPLRTVKL